MGNQPKLPVVFLADDARPLGTRCIKSYSDKLLTEEKHVSYYRLYHKRGISENGFGIWSNRFSLFVNKALLIPDEGVKATEIASLVLQILLRTKSRDSYTLFGFTNQVAVDRSTLEGIWGETGKHCTMANLQKRDGKFKYSES